MRPVTSVIFLNLFPYGETPLVPYGVGLGERAKGKTSLEQLFPFAPSRHFFSFELPNPIKVVFPAEDLQVSFNLSLKFETSYTFSSLLRFPLSFFSRRLYLKPVFSLRPFPFGLFFYPPLPLDDSRRLKTPIGVVRLND